MNKQSFYREQAEKFREFSNKFPHKESLSLFQEWSNSKDFSEDDKKGIWEIIRVSGLRKAYSTIDSVMQEVFLDEEQALQGMCSLLESENLKFKSKIIDDVISVLKQWNKIPVNEIRDRVDELVKNKLDKS